MCVIAVYNKGLDLNKEELKTCYNNNPDGAGLMYYDRVKKKTRIKKGFFSFKEFWKVASQLPTDIDRVFHFRIATSGAISPSTCHPFALSDDYKIMGKANTYADIGMVHNGILDDYTPKKGMKSKHSDTMQFIKEMAYPLGDAIWKSQVRDLLEEHINGNKLVFVGSDKLAVLGAFEESAESGALYSNSSYKKSRWDIYFENDYCGTKYDTYYDVIEPTEEYVNYAKEFAPLSYESGFKIDDMNWDGPTMTYPVLVNTNGLDDETIDYVIDDLYDLSYQYGYYVWTYQDLKDCLIFWVDRPAEFVGLNVRGASIEDCKIKGEEV